MPFDDSKWDKPAIQGDIGGLALTTSMALDSLRQALANLKDGKDISEQLDEIQKQSAKLDKMFDELTGYHANARR